LINLVRRGINPYLSSWKSAEADSTISPKGFHELSEDFNPNNPDFPGNLSKACPEPVEGR
jgi:hypothetical protein